MNKINSIDNKLLYSLFALLLFGLAMIASAGIAYSRTRFGDPYYFFKHQLFYGVLPGLVVLFITQKINYNFWKKVSFPFFAVSIIFLILVFVPAFGSKIYGASRWLRLGSFSFQPSEMLKLSIVVYLAAWLESRSERVKDFYEGLVPFTVIVGLVSFLLIKQPDMGTLGVIILISMSVFFVSGARISHMALMGGTGLAALWILIKTESYRMDRFLVFLHPELDPRGIGYQINQALLAIGSGGIFGVGLGHSLQKFNYLPEPVGDSIFAIIGEELGLIGCVILISIFVFLALRGFRIAQNAPDKFSEFLAAGITAWIIFQAFINMAAISGLIPLTGIPLPFISYGGTSIIFLMAGVGILLNISKYAREL
ncbi:MAG: cell division protein FtsW [Candidatus Moranbacteria bacterium RIFOXYA12_FULL_44_15]|nr:MAG: cell division protein FtsW [Candidatus Moranbacteria bacterium RIFOXYA12_FULL_44_15]OGI36418.1 MAG: cell division protein FtsW [Candidatus Moranbacteria bacterium RIFOXYA2_FULL_43_15]